MLLNKKLLLTPASTPVSSPRSSRGSGLQGIVSTGEFIGNNNSSTSYNDGNAESDENDENDEIDENDENDEYGVEYHYQCTGKKLKNRKKNRKEKKSRSSISFVEPFEEVGYSESDDSDYEESREVIGVAGDIVDQQNNWFLPKLTKKNSICKKNLKLERKQSYISGDGLSVHSMDNTTNISGSTGSTGSRKYMGNLKNIKDRVMSFSSNLPTALNNFVDYRHHNVAMVSNDGPLTPIPNTRCSSSSSSSSSYFTNRYEFMMQHDIDARDRCFNYILETIDAVWAKYCDTTTLVEQDLYSKHEDDQDFANDENLVGYEREGEGDKYFNNQRFKRNGRSALSRRKSCSSVMSNRSSTSTATSMTTPNTCDPYGMESDGCGMMNGVSCYGTPGTELEIDADKLTHFKQRLLSTKTYMEDLVDSADMVDLVNFWKKWDLIKYNCIQFMENDDDEDDEGDDGGDGNQHFYHYNYYGDGMKNYSPVHGKVGNDNYNNIGSFKAQENDSFEKCDEMLKKLENGRYYYNTDDI